MNLLKEWRIWIIIIFVIGSLIMIAPLPKEGVVVKSIDTDSPLYGKIKVGDTIEWANEKEINSPEDFYQFENFVGTFRFMHSGQLELVGIENPGLKVIVTKPPVSNLNLGMDLIGGTRVLLKPKTNVSDIEMQQILATLETRINTYGLREAKFQNIKDISGNNYAQIEMAGGSKEEIENLLSKQGVFEGKIPKLVLFSDNTGELRLGDNKYRILLEGDKIKLNNVLLSINETSKIEDIDFEVLNISSESAALMFTVFTGDDIKQVCLQEQPGICISRVLQQENEWEFMFQVFISEKSAEKFAKVTKGMKGIVSPSGESYLESRIYFYLDKKYMTDLGIASDLAGKAITEPSITGGRETKDEAVKEKLTLQSILQSGSLPVSLDIIKIDQISASLGQGFIKSAMIAVAIASIFVAGVIFFRYRRIKILVPMIIWSASELVLTLGAASIIGWTIDLASIAGLIAAIGTGTNDQIMIIDEIIIGSGSEEKRLYTLKQRIKRAFFIIFGAAGTIIAAMLPLMFVGIGVMKGFAIVTTLGVLIGVFITRPAFAKVAEKVLEKEGS